LDLSKKGGSLIPDKESQATKVEKKDDGPGIASLVENYLKGAAGGTVLGGIIGKILPSLLTPSLLAAAFAQSGFNIYELVKRYIKDPRQLGRDLSDLGTPDANDYRTKKRMGLGGWTHGGMWEGARYHRSDTSGYTDPWAIPGTPGPGGRHGRPLIQHPASTPFIDPWAIPGTAPPSQPQIQDPRTGGIMIQAIQQVTL
jgi:hypothetical protein